MEGIAIGVGSAALAALVVFLATTIARLWHSPKRLDRIERILPAMVRAMLAILKCQKAGVCNGDTDEAIAEINKLLSDGIVSQKVGK